MYELSRWNVFGRDQREQCERVRFVSCWYDLAEREHLEHCLCIHGLQRGFYWPERRPVHRMRRWEIQDDER